MCDNFGLLHVVAALNVRLEWIDANPTSSAGGLWGAYLRFSTGKKVHKCELSSNLGSRKLKCATV
jgi:hypothetical protein